GNCSFGAHNGPAISAQICSPPGIAIDKLGSIYIADSINNRIRKVISSTGIIITVVGGGTTLGDNGPASAAELDFPCGVAVKDDASVFFIADSHNHRIRKVAYYPLEETYLPIVVK
ncbi:MAG: hypothetical protein GY938_14095, partial [Ketobacter sp.]|nr:hypothetical protein [Ketobacter sp.]